MATLCFAARNKFKEGLSLRSEWTIANLLPEERHGHRIAIIGDQEMQISMLDKKCSRRNLCHL